MTRSGAGPQIGALLGPEPLLGDSQQKGLFLGAWTVPWDRNNGHISVCLCMCVGRRGQCSCSCRLGLFWGDLLPNVFSLLFSFLGFVHSSSTCSPDTLTNSYFPPLLNPPILHAGASSSKPEPLALALRCPEDSTGRGVTWNPSCVPRHLHTETLLKSFKYAHGLQGSWPGARGPVEPQTCWGSLQPRTPLLPWQPSWRAWGRLLCTPQAQVLSA